MALLTSTNSKEQEKQVMREFAIKMKLEKNMQVEIKQLFKRMSTAFAVGYERDGTVINFETFTIDWIALLRKWYTKTASIFSKNIRGDLKGDTHLLETKQELENSKEEQQEINSKIAAGLLIFIERQSKEQADYIINTSNKLIRQDVRQSTNNLIEEGITPTRQVVAEASRKKFNQGNVARSEAIAEQEIGMMASESKEEEANVLNQSAAVVAGVAVASLIKKNWNEMLDKKTRASHVLAGMTYRFDPISLTEKFIVQGEALRYPRDPAGSISNIARCRCESLYVLDKS